MNETVIFSIVCIAMLVFALALIISVWVNEHRATKRHKAWMEEMRRRGYLR